VARVGEPDSKAKAVEQYKHWPNKSESADLVSSLDVARMGEPDSKVKVKQYKVMVHDESGSTQSRQ